MLNLVELLLLVAHKALGIRNAFQSLRCTTTITDDSLCCSLWTRDHELVDLGLLGIWGPLVQIVECHT